MRAKFVLKDIQKIYIQKKYIIPISDKCPIRILKKSIDKNMNHNHYNLNKYKFTETILLSSFNFL